MAGRDPASLKRLATLCVRTCLGVRSGERVVVVADRENQDRAEALVAAATQEGTEPVVVWLPRFRPYAKDPPATAVAAMKAADVVLVALSQLPSTSSCTPPPAGRSCRPGRGSATCSSRRATGR